MSTATPSRPASPVDPSTETAFGTASPHTSHAPPTPAAADAATQQVRRYLNRPAGPAGTHGLPKMPRVGLPESVYLKAASDAKARGDDLTHEAAKVGQYLSLALRDADAQWGEKLKYFRHALKRHSQPPEHADDLTRQWFKQLARHVKAYAGAEAVRLAAEVDECYGARRGMGQTAEEVCDDAEEFFDRVCPHCDDCPPIYNEADWVRLKEYRDKWI